MTLKNIISELEEIEEEWNSHAIAEKLGGNVVKEAHYKGTATGVRIAINVLNDRISDKNQAVVLTTKSTPGVPKANSRQNFERLATFLPV